MKKLLSSLFILLLLATCAMAQERTVSGTVKGKDDGLPLPGVSVRVKGTTTGTQTGANGQFSIRVPGNNAVLVFTYIGYATQDVTVGSKTVVNVALVSDSKQLGEVVVTALGISREKKAVGYASTQVTSEEINRAAPVNIVSGLQGKVAGVDISTTSGSPGGSSKVVLRGFSSIGGSNQPLYVIDGVPVSNFRPGGTAPVGTIGDIGENFDPGNAMNDINPNDIESVNILKGAAATSLYGSRGSAGVILITTKKGKSGAFKVDFVSSASFTNVSIVPKLQDQYGQGWSKQNWIAENGSWGPKLDGQVRGWGSFVDGVQQQRPFSAIENNFRDAFDTGKEFSNTIGLSGGNENSTFRFSYGNVSSDGILPSNSDSYKRNSLSLNGSTKYKGFTASSSFNYVGKNTRSVQANQGESGIGSNFYEEILQIPVNYPIKEFKDIDNPYYNVDNYFTPYAENPYYPLYKNGSLFKSDRLYGNVDLKLRATNWVTFQFQQGFDVNNTAVKIWHEKNAPTPGSWANGGNDEGEARAEDIGNVVEGTERSFEYDSKLNALFDSKINSDINFNGVVGLNYNDRGSRVLYTGVEDLAIPGFFDLSNSSNKPVSTPAERHRRLLGIYASATFGYKNFTYLTLNARNDWSSTLPKSERSYFYPSANLAVVLSDALDLSSSKISLLKIRASYGRTGNDTDPYRVADVLKATDVNLGFGDLIFPLAGVQGFSISNTLNNSELKPEISTEAEFGGEIRFFNNRLGLDASYYNRITKDQILPVPIASSTGYNFRVVNFGRVRNKGIEVALNGTPVKSKDVTWEIGYTFTRNRNKVLELPEGLKQVQIASAYDAKFLAKVGQPLGVIDAPVPATDPQGRIIVNSSTGLPIVASDLSTYGSSQRDFIMGLTNSVSYKEFTLGFTFDWRKGGVFYSGTADLLNFVGNDIKTLYNDRRTFIVPNSVNAITDAQGNTTYVENATPLSENNFYAYFYTNDGKAVAYNNRILDKSYLKLRDLTLTYSLPKTIAARLHTDRATITAFARNLYTWLPKSNRTIDPEVSNYGNDLRSEFGEFRTGPSTRNFGLSLNLSF